MLQLRDVIGELEAILGDPLRLREVIATELATVREKFATPRKTAIVFDPGDLGTEDLIEDEELVVTFDARRIREGGLCRRVPDPVARWPWSSGRAAERGGSGCVGRLHDIACASALLLQPRQGLPTSRL